MKILVTPDQGILGIFVRTISGRNCTFFDALLTFNPRSCCSHNRCKTIINSKGACRVCRRGLTPMLKLVYLRKGVCF